jgi:TRAP transporter TAXI family solute receptor
MREAGINIIAPEGGQMTVGLPQCSASRWNRYAVVAAAVMGMLVSPLQAQRAGGAPAGSQLDLKGIGERMNANTVTIATSEPPLGYVQLGYDLAAVLNKDDDLRILPVLTKGAYQNVLDVRFLHGMDLGFTQTNVLGHYRRSKAIGDLSDKLVYILKVCNQEFHVIVHSDIQSIEQLRGRKVNFSTPGSGTQMSARDIMGRLGITVEEVNYGPADAMEKLKNGQIDAIVITVGKPAPGIAPLKVSDGYHILPMPYTAALIDDYLPTTLTHDDYPNLIAPGETIDTLASGTVLLAYNWSKNSDRYRRIDKFVQAFFSSFSQFLKPPRHNKWHETNLAGTVPGWKRFEGAEEWLRNNGDQTTSAAQFDRFLADRQITSARRAAMSEGDRNKLFEEFLVWSRRRQ